MLHYIIQTIVFQLFFLMVYDLFLKRETFFNWNRFYLLASAVLSITLPFVRIEYFKTVIPIEYTIALPEIILNGGVNEIANHVNRPLLDGLNANPESFFTWSFVFYLGCFVASLVFIYKLFRILFLVYKNPKTKFKDAFLIQLLNSELAFSFFNYIFIGEQIQGEEKKTIIAHEEVHVKQKHSIDLLFFEVLRILFWFNPLVYMYQNRIANLHEFIADSEAIKVNKVAYYENLLAQVFQTQNVSFINPFFKKSLIKKRIIMLNKTKSKQLNLIKYALLIPMVFGMIMYTSCVDKIEDDIVAVENNDLEQYRYSLEEGEEMSDEKKAIQSKAEAFLEINNKAYVSWGSINKVTGKTVYSIHKVSENAPKTHTEIDITLKSGGFYKAFVQPGIEPNNAENIALINVLNSGKQILKNNDWVTIVDVDVVPVFPGCETSMTNEDRRKCLSDNISKLILKNFNTNIGESFGLVGSVKISVFFVISKDGNIKGLKARAPHKSLETEAKRVLNLMPKLIPGKDGGENVDVAYYVPIKFNIK